MKKRSLKILIIVIVIFGILLCVNLIGQSIHRVSMVVKEGTLTSTGATIIITDNNYQTYTYGEWYEIEKKENHEWKKLELLDNFWSGFFSTKAIRIKKGKELQMEIKWINQYGELAKGEYRLLKKADNNIIFTEFIIY